MGIETGNIIVTSWGHEQTNVDFYQVVKRTPKQVTLRKIAKTESSDGALTMTGKVMPVKDKFVEEYTFRRKVIAEHDGIPSGVMIHDYAWGRVWDGTPQGVSHYA